MSTSPATQPNPALAPLAVLLGSWTTVGTHGLLPGITLHGRTTFEWLEGGAFMLMRSELDDARFPTSVAVFASDDAKGEYYMLHFDSRGVSRKHDLSVHENVVRWWRTAPAFSQRYTWTIADDGKTILGKGELSRDGRTWEQDLDLTYSRSP